MPTPQDLISTREAMEILGYANPSSVARLVYEHKVIPAFPIEKFGSYVFHRSDIEKLAASRKPEEAAS